MDVRRLGFPDATFDGAWASASLLHLPKPDLPAALGEISRVLVADGAFYASLKRGTTTSRTDDGRFFARYRPAELVDHVEAAGFAVDERWADDGWVRLRCRPE
jgi:ubiquinone/menaquinone biosynthesis C-methylase UbiE